MIHSLLLSALLTVFAATSGIAVSPNQAGNILVDDHGMTLYRFTPDQPNNSVCYGSCASDWPPVLVDSIPSTSDASLGANLGIAPRTDGTQQLTYQGSPLYYFVADAQPGDTNGQGVSGVWFVVTTS
jgi:predicted lipoprotein with Yx(FWY)xxD motif